MGVLKLFVFKENHEHRVVLGKCVKTAQEGRVRKRKLTLHFQVSRTLGISGGKRHLACLRHFAVVQDQSVFGTVLHDLNVLQMADKLQHFSKKTRTQEKVIRARLWSIHFHLLANERSNILILHILTLTG